MGASGVRSSWESIAREPSRLRPAPPARPGGRARGERPRAPSAEGPFEDPIAAEPGPELRIGEVGAARPNGQREPAGAVAEQGAQGGIDGLEAAAQALAQSC